MKVCVREGYVDAFVLSRIDEKTLKKKPYSFQIVDVPDDCIDCSFEDFEKENKKFVFSLSNYNKRKQVENAYKTIADFKRLLQETDYLAIKFAEGAIGQDEFIKTKMLRQSYRDQINELEKIINGG